MRWFAVLGIALAWWAQGAVTSPLHAWLPYVVIAGALVLPDVAGFAIGGLRVDMREARREIAQLRQEVNAQARATASASVGPITTIVREARPGLEVYGNVTGAEREPLEPYVPRPLDTDGTAEVRSELWPTSASPAAHENRYSSSATLTQKQWMWPSVPWTRKPENRSTFPAHLRGRPTWPWQHPDQSSSTGPGCPPKEAAGWSFLCLAQVTTKRCAALRK